MSRRAAAAPPQHPVAISTASAAADIFNIGNRRAAVFTTLRAAEKNGRCRCVAAAAAAAARQQL